MAFSLFPALFDHPTGMRFAEQEKDEVIELLLRQHWVTNVPWLFFIFLGFFVPPLIIAFQPLFPPIIPYPIPPEITLGAIIVWYLFLLAYAMENFLHWYFNIYIVTNKHLVDINFRSILHRDILEAGLENVESASSKITGLTRSFFNYGDVVVQTAAESQQITFLAVPHPDKVTDRINDLKEAKQR